MCIRDRFDTATAEDVIMHILGLPTDIFNVYPASIKYKTYQARWQIGDIYVSGDARKTEDNPQGLGCYLVMTGRGCNDIFRILDSRNYTFGDMFRRCERRYGLDTVLIEILTSLVVQTVPARRRTGELMDKGDTQGVGPE